MNQLPRSMIMRAISTATKLAILASGIYIGAIGYPRIKECLSDLMDHYKVRSSIASIDERIVYMRELQRRDPIQYNALLLCATAYTLRGHYAPTR